MYLQMGIQEALLASPEGIVLEHNECLCLLVGWDRHGPVILRDSGNRLRLKRAHHGTHESWSGGGPRSIPNYALFTTDAEDTFVRRGYTRWLSHIANRVSAVLCQDRSALVLDYLGSTFVAHDPRLRVLFAPGRGRCVRHYQAYFPQAHLVEEGPASVALCHSRGIDKALTFPDGTAIVALDPTHVPVDPRVYSWLPDGRNAPNDATVTWYPAQHGHYPYMNATLRDQIWRALVRLSKQCDCDQEQTKSSSPTNKPNDD